MSVVTFGNQPFTVVKCRATEEQFQQFVQGTTAVFNQWTALGLVSLHCDPRARDNLLQHVLQWFHQNGEVYSDELELFFEDYFAAARSVVLEDDSMKEVSDILHEMYCLCCRGDYSKVQFYVQMQSTYQQMNTLGQCLNQTADDDDIALGLEEDDGNEDDDGNEEGIPEPPQAQTNNNNNNNNNRNRNQKKKKNASRRTADGWNEVY